MAIATAGSIGSFICVSPAKANSRPSAGDNAQVVLNDSLPKRGYGVTILCHGSQSVRTLTQTEFSA